MKTKICKEEGQECKMVEIPNEKLPEYMYWMQLCAYCHRGVAGIEGIKFISVKVDLEND